MRRAGNLFEQIVDPDNQRRPFCRARRGKRDRPEAQQFAARVDEQLDRMAQQVWAGAVPVGHYHPFVVYDPNERIITAPCFAERVLHHAVLC